MSRGRGHSEGTRVQVLAAAMKKFSEKSFLGATTAEIAVEANVSEKTIFDLVGDKKTLYLEVRDSIHGTMLRDMLTELPLGSGACPLLRELGKVFMREVNKNREKALLSIHAITAIDDPDLKKSTQKFFLQVQEAVKEILVTGQRVGLVREGVDLEQFAWTYTMALISTVYATIMELPPEVPEETALLFINRLVDQIEPDREDA